MAAADLSDTARLLSTLAQAGVAVRVEGEDLIFSSAPPGWLIDEARRRKSGLLAEVRRSRLEPPAADDWKLFFEERIALRQFDGRLEAPAAELGAWEDCVVEWLRQNPPPRTPWHVCAWCRGPVTTETGLPFLIRAGVNAWLHPECHPLWFADWRRQALEALGQMGLQVICTRAWKS